MHGVYILFFDNHKMIPIQALRGNTVEKTPQKTCAINLRVKLNNMRQTHVSMSTETVQIYRTILLME